MIFNNFKNNTDKIIKEFVFISVCLILLSILSQTAICQTDSVANGGQAIMGEFNTLEKKPEGTEFWLTFMLNNEEPDRPTENTKLHLELFFTGDKEATVTIEIKALDYKETITVPKGTVKSLIINPLAQIRTSETIEFKYAIHITSNNPITVYGLNRRRQTTDTFMGLPTNVIGKNYRVICYTASVKLSEFAIVATEDSTVVKITPSVETQVGRQAGKTFDVRLNKGDVYQVIAKDIVPARKKNDLTGTQINSNKKISVFSGHQCAYVPERVFACNHLVEQVPPIVSWGKQFYIGMLKKRSQYTYRVLADKDSTKIFENGKLVKVLMAGDYFEKNAKDHVQIVADKPILVAQYSQGYKNGDQIGDPMMLLISPTQQFLQKYRFATPVNGTWEHFVNIIVPQRATNSLIFDGRRLDSAKFTPLANSSYSIAQVNVPFGTHEMEAAVPFGMSSYGFGYANENYDAYGTIGGQSFIEYIPKEDEEAPYLEVKEINDKLNIIIRDDRKDDTGVNLITTLSADGLKAVIPTYDIGTPQTQISVEKDNLNKLTGKLQLSIEDMYKNTKLITICYTYDAIIGKYRYIVSNGLDVECSVDPGFFLGFSAKVNYNRHIIEDKTFSATGNLYTNGYFSDAEAVGGYFSIYAAKRFTPKLLAKISLNFDNIAGTVISPDSVISKVFNPNTNNLDDFQEQSNLTLNGLNLGINLGGEYILHRAVYVNFGASVSFLLSSSVTHSKQIIKPLDKAYNNLGDREKIISPSELTSLNTLGYGAYFGLGFIQTISPNVFVNLESNYNFRFNSLVSDNSWTLQYLNINLGLRFRI